MYYKDWKCVGSFVRIPEIPIIDYSDTVIAEYGSRLHCNQFESNLSVKFCCCIKWRLIFNLKVLILLSLMEIFWDINKFKILEELNIKLLEHGPALEYLGKISLSLIIDRWNISNIILGMPEFIISLASVEIM